MGSTLTLKTTFLTKKEFATTEFIALFSPSEKKNQTIMPELSQRIKGTLLTGRVLKPTSKTNHKTQIIATGCANAQTRPKYEPKYFCLKSFLTRSRMSFLDLYMSFRNAKKTLANFTR